MTVAVIAVLIVPRAAHATPTVAIYREALLSDPTVFHFTFRSADEAARFGCVRMGVAFHAFASHAPGTVTIYIESPTTAPHSRYALSMRTDAEAERAGWGVRGAAFWAYPTARRGTIPVFLETPADAPNSRYNYSTRRRDEAARAGWRQIGIAFWVPDPQTITTSPPPPPPLQPPVVAPMPAETRTPSTRAP